MLENTYFVVPINTLTPVCAIVLLYNRTNKSEYNHPKVQSCDCTFAIVQNLVTIISFTVSQTCFIIIG